MGTTGLLFTVLAFTAPLGVVFGFVSVNISFGIGVPIAFVAVAVLMALFAMGFTGMTKAIPRPGAFYTYIREGLGRPLGLGGSFLALVTYGFNVTSCIVVSGIAVNNLLGAFLEDVINTVVALEHGDVRHRMGAQLLQRGVICQSPLGHPGRRGTFSSHF